jgi:hypothetical protein
MSRKATKQPDAAVAGVITRQVRQGLFNGFQPFGLKQIASPSDPCLPIVYLGFTNRVQTPRGLINSSPNLDYLQFLNRPKNLI